jgi:hypothetical protein
VSFSIWLAGNYSYKQIAFSRRPPVTIIETGYQSVVDDWKLEFGVDPQTAVHDQLNYHSPPVTPYVGCTQPFWKELNG